MTYSVKEMFYTLQGEGTHAGRPAVFCRFTGCNLWSGREADRAGGCSAWCDTDFVGTRGKNGGKYPAAGVSHKAAELWRDRDRGSRFIVLTGGEPMLQVDRDLVNELHRRGFKVAVETNGTIPVPTFIDWITVSPKAGSDVIQRIGQDLKLVFPQVGLDPSEFLGWSFDRFYIQPMDGPEREENTVAAVRYCLANPRWRLSLQTHKILGIN